MNPIAKITEDLNSKAWYKGNLNRVQAEELISKLEIGGFIVRSSSKPNHYAVTYKNTDGKPAHSLIVSTPEGYGLPEDEKGRKFATLEGLLRQCKFIKFDTPVSDLAIATLEQTFPTLKKEEILKAYEKTNRNLAKTITVLNIWKQKKAQDTYDSFASKKNNRQTSSDSVASLSSSSASQNPTIPRNSATTPQIPVSPPSPILSIDSTTDEKSTSSEDYPLKDLNSSEEEEEEITISIADNFLSFSENKLPTTDIFDKWMKIHRPLDTPTPQLARIEQNIQKILQNTSHALGKKVNAFKTTFQTQYEKVNPQDISSLSERAIQELHTFMASIQDGIIFGGHDGSLIFWKSVESVLFTGIFDTLFGLIKKKNSEIDNEKLQLMKKLENASLYQLGVAESFELPQEPQPYLKAINFMKKLPNLKTVNEKLNCLVTTCQTINLCVQEYFKKYPSKEGTPVVSVIDLMPLFTYVLCKSMVPNIHSELLFLREFTPSKLKSGQDGFALATLQTCVNYLEKVEIKTDHRKESFLRRVSVNLTSQLNANFEDMKDDVDFELTTPISRKEILESEKVQKIPNIEKTESKKNIPFFERIKRSKKADIDPIILEIQNGLETNFNLSNNPDRKFVKKGMLKMKKDGEFINCELFLFTDLVIMTVQGKTGGRKIKAKVLLSEPEARIVNTADQPGITAAFEINSKKQQNLLFASSNEEKQEWLKELKNVKRVFQLRPENFSPTLKKKFGTGASTMRLTSTSSFIDKNDSESKTIKRRTRKNSLDEASLKSSLRSEIAKPKLNDIDQLEHLLDELSQQKVPANKKI